MKTSSRVRRLGSRAVDAQQVGDRVGVAESCGHYLMGVGLSRQDRNDQSEADGIEQKRDRDEDDRMLAGLGCCALRHR